MQRLPKELLKGIARTIPFSFYRLLVKKDLLVLCYHAVSDRPLLHIAQYSYKTSEAFENDIAYLKQNFNLISYAQLISHVSCKSTLKNNSVLLTFDDGLSQCFSVVRPILLKHKVPCVFFVTTDALDNNRMPCEDKIALCLNVLQKLKPYEITQVLSDINSAAGEYLKNFTSLVQWLKNLNYSNESIIDKVCRILKIDVAKYLQDEKPYLTSEEIKILAADDFTIGGHGKSHTRLDLLNAQDMEKEIVDSCKIIMDLLGVEHVPFAFPYHGIYLDRKFLKNIIAKYKFIDLFFDTQYLREDVDFVINRVWVDSPTLGKSGKSNIPKLLSCAYMDYLRYKYLNYGLR